MKVTIFSESERQYHDVQIVCECGSKMTTDTEKNLTNFKHQLPAGKTGLNLRCKCGQEYTVTAGRDYLQIFPKK